jgi:molybdopterin synthase catalytic subunit/molybdopterin converting factor small subunit
MSRAMRVCYNHGVMVTVRLFASYREAVGSPVVQVPLEDGAGGQALWTALVTRYPALGSLPAPAGYAVNDEYVRDLRALKESDRVALIPPVSGGEERPPLLELVDRPISVDRILHEAADPRAGAVVLFLGTVRDNARGRRVQHLTYEAYEALARREMERIAAMVAERWPVTRVVIVHRTGRLQVGDISVAIGVSAPHRAEAFDAGRFAIDTLKTTVPIWKKEVWEGGEAWVGTEPRTRGTSR